MNLRHFLISFACAGLITSCAANFLPPAELNDARQAYARASVSPAAQFIPENLYRAREALVRAEQSFLDNPRSDRTRILATIAHREARLAVQFTPIAPDSAVDRIMGQKIPEAGN